MPGAHNTPSIEPSTCIEMQLSESQLIYPGSASLGNYAGGSKGGSWHTHRDIRKFSAIYLLQLAIGFDRVISLGKIHRARIWHVFVRVAIVRVDFRLSCQRCQLEDIGQRAFTSI